MMLDRIGIKGSTHGVKVSSNPVTKAAAKNAIGLRADDAPLAWSLVLVFTKPGSSIVRIVLMGA